MTDPPKILNAVQGLRALPESPRFRGIYFLCDQEAVVYVGQSIDIATRITAHRDKAAIGRVKHFDRVFWIECERKDLDWLETFWIEKLKPRDNKVPGPLARNGAQTRKLRKIDSKNERRARRLLSEENQGFKGLDFTEDH